MKPPFQMRTETDLEQWRHDTWDTKEPETIEWIKGFAHDAVFYDIGANVGVYTLYCAAVHPQAVVYAFEPHPENWRALEYNRQANGFDRINVISQAVGDKCGLCAIMLPGMAAGISGTQMTAAGNGMVSRTTIDEYVKRHEPPTHVKIDIDGQEAKVIAGMRDTLLSPTLRSVLVEVTPDSAGPICATMSSAGFSTLNRYNCMSPHSLERRIREGIPERNIIFTRRTQCY